MFLPSYTAPAKAQIRVVVFLDTSGSCTWMISTFMTIIASMPKEIFSVTAFTFSNSSIPFDIKNPSYRGGGTSFNDLEQNFDAVVAKDNADGKHYQHYAIVLTDGEGTQFEPKNPKQWFFFMPNLKEADQWENSKSYYPSKMVYSTRKRLHPDINCVDLGPFLPSDVLKAIEEDDRGVLYAMANDARKYEQSYYSY